MPADPIFFKPLLLTCRQLPSSLTTCLWPAPTRHPPASRDTQAGGRAIARAKSDIQDLPPTGIHDRCPIYLGSKLEVDRIEQLYAESA